MLGPVSAYLLGCVSEYLYGYPGPLGPAELWPTGTRPNRGVTAAEPGGPATPGGGSGPAKGGNGDRAPRSAVHGGRGTAGREPCTKRPAGAGRARAASAPPTRGGGSDAAVGAVTGAVRTARRAVPQNGGGAARMLAPLTRGRRGPPPPSAIAARRARRLRRGRWRGLAFRGKAQPAPAALPDGTGPTPTRGHPVAHRSELGARNISGRATQRRRRATPVAAMGLAQALHPPSRHPRVSPPRLVRGFAGSALPRFADACRRASCDARQGPHATAEFLATGIVTHGPVGSLSGRGAGRASRVSRNRGGEARPTVALGRVRRTPLQITPNAVVAPCGYRLFVAAHADLRPFRHRRCVPASDTGRPHPSATRNSRRLKHPHHGAMPLAILPPTTCAAQVIADQSVTTIRLVRSWCVGRAAGRASSGGKRGPPPFASR